MSDAWDDRKKALEESYFDKENKLALERLKNRKQARPSPITGEPMEQVTYMGVVIDRCTKSGGVWLDAGELEQIIKTATQKEHQDNNILGGFFDFLSKPSK